MDSQDLIRTAGDVVASGLSADVAQVIGAAGGVVLKEGGRIALGVLISRGADDLLHRYQRAKAKKKIAENFEATEHGAALLQEALNALLEGLDQERAEAVKKVFLGLAMNPVGDSIERVEQLDIMRIASELTAWELVLMNSLERFRKDVFNSDLAESWRNASTSERKNQIRQNAKQQSPSFSAFLVNDICGGDKTRFANIKDAYASLASKRMVLRNASSMEEVSMDCVLHDRGAFNVFGWKLAVHLYSATDE